MKTRSTNTGEASSPLSQKNNVHNRAGDDGNNNDADGNKNINSDETSNTVGDGDEALGSGMAAFFGDFVPYQSDTNDKPIGFSTGLSRLPAVPTNPIENANHIEASIGIKYIDGGLLYSQWRNKEKEYLTNYLMLRLYPHPDEGITTQSGDNSTFSSSESSSDDEGDGDEEVDPESQLAMETQEPLVVAENSRLPDEEEEVEPESQLAMETQAEKLRSSEQGESSSRKRKKRSRRDITIPCVEDCLHDLTKLEFLDLHARTLSLNLSRIDKVWKLRDTKRSSGALAKCSIRKPVFKSSSCSPPSRSRKAPQQQQLPQRLVFEEKEEDGPAAAIYKTVVHFEVEQLHVAQTGGPGGVVGGPNDLLVSSSSNTNQQRIKVFFYNSYATAVSEWIKEQQKQQSGKKRKHDNSSDDSTTTATDIVMSLSNIPAACIFPYAVDPRNWREKQNLVDYCLCIGDTSIATTKKNQEPENHYNDTGSKIRFDSKEMEIRLMAVVTRTTVSRTRTASGSIVVTNDVVDDVDVSSELILSRRTLAKEFLSSQENTPQAVEGGEKEKELRTSSDDNTSSLQKSWESYKKNRDQGPNNTTNPMLPNQGENRQSTSLLNKRPPLRQLNHQGLSEPAVVEPIMVEGGTQRRSDSKDTNYVRLVSFVSMILKTAVCR